MCLNTVYERVNKIGRQSAICKANIEAINTGKPQYKCLCIHLEVLDSVCLKLIVHIYTGSINESTNVLNRSIIPRSKIKAPKAQFWLLDYAGQKRTDKSQKWSLTPLMPIL